MKKVFRYLVVELVLAAALLGGLVDGGNALAAAPTPQVDSLWEQANTLYINGDYKGAIDLYEQIEAMDLVSAELFYNLGNARFKDDRLGEAIVALRKAELLAPSDPDVEYNLAVANSYVKDRLNVMPEFFLNRWMRALRGLFTAKGWAVLSLVFLALTSLFVVIFLLSRSLARRKIGFALGVLSLLMFILSIGMSISASAALKHGGEAVIISESASVKSSPDRAGIDLFILHEGTSVEVVTEFGDWREILLSDGSKGWIRSEQIECVSF